MPSVSIIASHLATLFGTPPRSHASCCSGLVIVSNADFRSDEFTYSGVLWFRAVSARDRNCSVTVVVLRPRRKACCESCK